MSIFMSMNSRALLWVLSCVGIALVGCGDDAAPSNSGPGCRLNSDCPVGEVCQDGACMAAQPCDGDDCPCLQDADCGDGQLCNLQTGACFTPECQTDAACALGEVCLLGRCLADVDADRDRDGVPDGSEAQPRDNCPTSPNPDQEDLDADGQGDVCDLDDDGDGVDDLVDNCPRTANGDQADRSDDGVGDACEPDSDHDGTTDDLDNCPLLANAGQSDLDDDGAGDACDEDDDGDDVPDELDTCPRLANPDQQDRDSDGQGDACEGDYDSDGVTDDLDRCPRVADPDQADTDRDGDGDACDPDDDGDGIFDDEDNCPLVPNPTQDDVDGQGPGNACDSTFAGVTLQGQLVIADNSLGLFDPLEGFGAATAFLEGPEAGSVTPTMDGLILFSGIRTAGRYDLVVQWPTWQVGRASVELDLNEPVVERELYAVHQSQLGQTAQALRGRVLLEDQVQHGGTTVIVRLPNDRLFATTTTDAEGWFSVMASVESPYLLSFEHTAFVSAQWPAPVRWDDTTLAFLLDGTDVPPTPTLAWDRSASLTATLTSTRSPTPFGSASATLRCVGSPCPEGEEALSVGGDASVTGSELVPGLYNLHIGLAGYGAIDRTVALHAGANTLGSFELVHESQTAQAVPVTGLALLGGGRADHSGISATLFRASDRAVIGTATTDPDGNFAIPASRFETYELRFARASYATQTVPTVTWSGERFVMGNGQPITATLPPLQVNGSVTTWITLSPSWIPATQRGVQVQLTRLGDEPASASGGAIAGVNAGSDIEPGETPAVATGLGAGTWLLSVIRPGFEAVQQTVTISAEAPAVTVRLELGLENLGSAGLDLFGQRLTDAEFRAIPGLRGANLAGVEITGNPPNLTCLDLTGVNLTEAVMPRADLSGANLDGASLRGALLSDADLTPHTADCPSTGRPAGHHRRSTLLTGTDLTGAALDGAIWGTEVPVAAPCEQAPGQPRVVVDGARFQLADLSDAQMVGLELPGIDLSSALLVGVNFTSACLSGASLILANLSGALLDDADLSGAQLVNAVLVPRIGAGPGGEDVPTSAARANLSSALMTNIIAERAFLTDAVLEGANLNGANFVGAQMSGVRARSASFLGAVFGNAVVQTEQGPVVVNSVMRRAQLDEAELSGVIFNQVKLSGSSFVRANMPFARFIANFEFDPTRPDFTEANMRGVDLYQANLPQARFVGADLTSANLSLAELQNAQFSDCVWTDDGVCSAGSHAACFSGCEVGAARLDNAVLVGTRLYGTNLRGASFQGATLQGVYFDASQLEGSLWLHARIEQSTFEEARMVAASLDDTRVEGVSFARAFLQRASFADSTVHGSSFMEATLDGANLDKADLSGSSLLSASLRRAQLPRVLLTDVSLRGAHVEGANLALVDLDGADLRGLVWSAETDWTSARFRPTTTCPGIYSWSQTEPYCGIVRPVTTVGVLGGLTGSLESRDPLWSRPSEACGAGSGVADRRYDFFFVVNDTGFNDLTITANWGAGNDGYLHVFKAPFDATSVVNCLAGDDDFNGQGMSQVVFTNDLRIAPDGGAPSPVLVIIASTYSANTLIPNYTITVSP